MITPEFAGLMLHDALWSGLAALGFAVLFNVPPRTLLGCFFGGASGHVLRSFLVALGVSLEFSTLAGAALVGLLAVGFGRRWHVPPAVFSVSGTIPMVPGVFAFSTMLGVIDLVNATDAAMQSAALVEVSVNAFRTALILAAIAVGITLPSLLFRQKMTERHR